MTAIGTQILLLREFLSVFQGNELVLGVVLAIWMILTGLGSFLGKFTPRVAARRDFFPAALLVLGLLPSLAVFLLRSLRNVLFLPGSMLGLTEVLWSGALLLFPFCLLSGFLFVTAVSLAAGRAGRPVIGLLYSWESLGSAAGGILFGVLFAGVLETFQALYLLLLGSAIASAAVARREGVRVPAAALAAAAGGAAVLFFAHPDLATRRYLFPGQEIIDFGDTPYGNLTVTRQGEQLNFFQNASLLFSTGDVVANEETVHFALAQRAASTRVLLLTGGISGTTQEILKYGVERIDYVEVDPRLISTGKKYTQSLEDARVRVITGDPRMYVRSTPEIYDAALVALPDPATAQVNRCYTEEFFRDLARVVPDSGVISISLLPAADYLGGEARSVSSALYATLRRVFPHVTVVPGDRNYFLASGAPLDVHIASLIRQRGIRTAYVNGDYLDDAQLAERSAAFLAGLDPASEVNSDFRPVCYYRQVGYWLSHFGAGPALWIGLVFLVPALMLRRLSVVGVGIFAGGAVASGLEIVLLLAYQVMYGSLYQMTGMVIASFMAGLAAGSFAVRRRRGTLGGFAIIQIALAAVCVLLPAGFRVLQGSGLPGAAVHAVFMAAAFLIAVLIGMEFAAASALGSGSARDTASALYGLDLAGSAAGALAASMGAIPMLGILNTSYAAGAVSAAGGLMCLAAGRMRGLSGR